MELTKLGHSDDNHVRLLKYLPKIAKVAIWILELIKRALNKMARKQTMFVMLLLMVLRN